MARTWATAATPGDTAARRTYPSESLGAALRAFWQRGVLARLVVERRTVDEPDDAFRDLPDVAHRDGLRPRVGRRRIRPKPAGDPGRAPPPIPDRRCARVRMAHVGAG